MGRAPVVTLDIRSTTGTGTSTEMGIGPGFSEQLVRFVRLLRKGGVRCGAGASIDALRAVEAVGVARRQDLFWGLHAVLVTRRDDHEVFRRAFDLVWRAPTSDATERALPGAPRTMPPPPPPPAHRRVEPEAGASAASAASAAPAAPAAATTPTTSAEPQREPDGGEQDGVLTWSDREVIRHRDFEQMTVAEVARARRMISTMKLDLPQRRTRRWVRDPERGRVDPRRTLQMHLRSGHGIAPPEWRRSRSEPLELVLLCDVSGSMERYARVVLHFAHALAAATPRVHTFVFGTRVTNVTRQLRNRDVDAALAAVGRLADDWSGGTRIGASLGAFNRRWSRRVLGRGAVVLLFTDGLDREGARGIHAQAARLRRSCRRLIWLNPLLRYDGFEPRAAGVRALLAEVDEHRPVHDLESLDQLAAALSRLS